MFLHKHKIDEAAKGEHTTPLHLTLSYCTAIKPLVDSLFSLAFELNKKTQLGLQICDALCLDCFSADTYHIEHKDSGFGQQDSGKKITCIYVIAHRPIEIKLDGSTIELQHNQLLLCKSRRSRIEIPAHQHKFYLGYWFIPGPCDPYC